MSIFEFDDYKEYLKLALDQRGEAGERGPRSRLAEFIGCQSAYVSRVLEADAHFSLEQADLINQYLNHRADESEFFFLLLQKYRAGTQSLSQYFQRKLDQALEERQNLKNRVHVKNRISEADQIRYFSQWQNAAIQVALLLPEYQNLSQTSALADRLRLRVSQVQESLDFLMSLGLIIVKDKKYHLASKRMHLGKESPIIVRHHQNWRLRAIDAIERDVARGLHYSSVVTLGRKDMDQIKELLITAIERTKAIIKDSKDETIASFCLDFYEF